MKKTDSAPEKKPLAEETAQFRRIVTGHDDRGSTIFVEDQICPNRMAVEGIPNFCRTEVWRIESMPDDNSGKYNDLAAKMIFPPTNNGSVFRILEIPPEGETGGAPIMHRTASTDYCYVIKGEIFAVLDSGSELLMKEGDILIQRGTNHTWSNRSNKPCIILFVLNGAKEIPNLPTLQEI